MTLSRPLTVLVCVVVLTIVGVTFWPRPGCGIDGSPPEVPAAPAQTETVEDTSDRGAVLGAAVDAAREPVPSGEEAWLEGTVRDSAGRPIFEAWVRAHVAGSDTSSPTPGPTDRKGCWRNEDVESGLLLLEVEVRARGFLSARVKPRSIIAPGKNHVIDIVLAEAPGFAGRVIDARSNRPIEGALVTLAKSISWVDAPVRSDAEGRFRLAGGLEEQLDVMVGKEGYAYDRAVWHATDAEHVVLLQPAVAVVSGLLLECDGSPAVDECVYVCTAAGRFAFLDTDAGGHFRFQPVPAGPARVCGFGLRKPGGRSKCVLREVELQPGENELRLQLEEPPESRITGLVLRDGAPLARARLAVVQWAPDRISPGNVDHWTLLTGDDGRFELAGLIPGHYAVSYDALDDSAGVPITHEFDLEAGQVSRELRFESVPAVQFEGRVLAPYPKGALQLELWEPGGKSALATSAVVGREQQFSLTAIPRGRYRLRLLDRGELVTELEVGPGPERQLEFLPAK